MRFFYFAFMCILVLVGLIACDSNDKAIPQVSINSPATGTSVSGTTNVQITAIDDIRIANVKLYVRKVNGKEEGRILGTAIREPYIINFNSLELPNLSEVELYVVATDGSGKKASSDPVLIRIQNPGVPDLSAFFTMIFPPQTDNQRLSLKEISTINIFPEIPKVEEVLPPQCFPHCPTRQHRTTNISHQSISNLNRALIWEVPCTGGVDGYTLYQNQNSLVGPYEEIRNTAVPSNCTIFKADHRVEAQAGDTFYGTVRAISGGGSIRSGSSNFDTTTFIQQTINSQPEQDSTITTGRPNLRWEKNTEADGYFYYVYNRSPWDKERTLVWGNYPKTTAKLSADYPTDFSALPSGTYYWWVAGVSFDSKRQADSFSFSEVKRFVVP